MDREELKSYTGPYTGRWGSKVERAISKCSKISREATNWSARKLSVFGLACYFGKLQAVLSQQMVQSGQAPSLGSHETPFHWDYVSIDMFAQQNDLTPSNTHQAGANVDHQNQYCEVSTFLAFPTNNIDFIDILFEHDGLTPRNTFIRHGPRVTPCLTKWISKREGINAPRKGGNDATALERTWAQHKKVCKPFDTSTTIVLIPNDYEIGSLQSMANFARSVFGSDQHLPTPKNTNRDAGVPRTKPRKPNIKNSIVKVQIAMGPTTTYDVIFDSNSFDPHGNLLIYTKNRDLVYTIHIKEQIGGVSAPGVG
ncbi:hypothetical protein GG344DRAFT_68601 [Lentinula edodes]|nr:hypothetical protein GG344DRAFT_68601 [Lentinula edodes]